MPSSSTRLSSLDQKELLQRANTFDKEALAAVFDIFYEPIHHYIYRYVQDDQAAEDLASEVFRHFLETLNTRHGPKKLLKAWLYKTAHHLMFENGQAGRPLSLDSSDDEYQDETEVVSQQAEDSIRKQVLMQALRQLTDKQQEVIYLRFFQGLRLEEVAYTLNMTVGTVKSLQHRGLQSMRRYLDDADQFDKKDL
jgi:RNA polymerase sigma factor (sigma-70 family)